MTAEAAAQDALMETERLRRRLAESLGDRTEFSGEMERSHREAVDGLQTKVAGLEGANRALEAHIVELNCTIDGLRSAITADRRQSGEQADRMRAQMEMMAAEFAEMLSSSLQRLGAPASANDSYGTSSVAAAAAVVET